MWRIITSFLVLVISLPYSAFGTPCETVKNDKPTTNSKYLFVPNEQNDGFIQFMYECTNSCEDSIIATKGKSKAGTTTNQNTLFSTWTCTHDTFNKHWVRADMQACKNSDETLFSEYLSNNSNVECYIFYQGQPYKHNFAPIPDINVCYQCTCTEGYEFSANSNTCISKQHATQQAPAVVETAAATTTQQAQTPASASTKQTPIEKCQDSRTTPEGQACCLVKESVATWDSANNTCKCNNGGQFIYKNPSQPHCTNPANKSDTPVSPNHSDEDPLAKPTTTNSNVNINANEDAIIPSAPEFTSINPEEPPVPETEEEILNNTLNEPMPKPVIPNKQEIDTDALGQNADQVDEGEETPNKQEIDTDALGQNADQVDEGEETPNEQETDTDALGQNSDQAHENENSLANRMLGGASMAAMGIGGMELAQGLAQQRADAKADADMTAYLATFKCEYGPNHADGNTTGNEIPGANQLFNLYQEYAALASSVKATKEALNMTPGIESQVILDKANIGLYDDVSTGKTNGTYASLYRAKMGSDVDQAKLQEMSDTSKNRIVGGAVAAGAGAIAGIGGDVLLNQIDWNKNNSDAEDAE